MCHVHSTAGYSNFEVAWCRSSRRHQGCLPAAVSLSHTLSHTLSFSHTHTLSLSLTHTHTNILSLSLTNTHSLSLSHTLSLTHTLSISLSQTHNLSLSHTQSLSHTHTLSLTLSLSHTLTHTQSLSLTHTQSLSHTHTLTLSSRWMGTDKFLISGKREMYIADEDETPTRSSEYGKNYFTEILNLPGPSCLLTETELSDRGSEAEPLSFEVWA